MQKGILAARLTDKLTWLAEKLFLRLLRGGGKLFPRISAWFVAKTASLKGERYRRVALATATGTLAKVIGMLSALITLPLTVGYLGQERYGLWATISAAAAMAGFADLGMGNSLMNAVAEASAKDSREAACRSVSSAFFVLTFTALIVFGLLCAIYPFVPWFYVFGARSALAAREAGPTLLVVAVFTLVSLPLCTVQRVQAGYQEMYATNLWQILGTILSLASLLLVVYLRGGLPWLVGALLGAPVVATIVNWCSQFLRSRPWLFPRWDHFDWPTSRTLLLSGMWLTLATVGSLVLFNSPVLMTSYCFGAAAGGEAAAIHKLATLPVFLGGLFWAPLWPAYAEAHASGEFTWIRHTLRRSLRLVALLVVTSLPVIALAGPTVVRIWSRGHLSTTPARSVAFSLLACLLAFRGPYSMLVAGCGRLRNLALVSIVSPVLALSMVPVLRLANSPVWVPLWIVVCEAFLLTALAREARKITAGRQDTLSADRRRELDATIGPASIAHLPEKT